MKVLFTCVDCDNDDIADNERQEMLLISEVLF